MERIRFGQACFVYRWRLWHDCPPLVELHISCFESDEEGTQPVAKVPDAVGWWGTAVRCRVQWKQGYEPFPSASFCLRANCCASRVVAKIINPAQWGAFDCYSSCPLKSGFPCAVRPCCSTEAVHKQEPVLTIVAHGAPSIIFMVLSCKVN